MLVVLQLRFALRRIIKLKTHNLVLLVFALVLFSSCGKRRPPVPPPAKNAVANALNARQQGNQIILKISVRNAKAVKQINIYRLNERQSTPNFVSEDDYTQRATLIGTITDLSALQDESAFYNDVLSNLADDIRLRYAVRLIYQEGRRSAISSFLIIEPNFQTPNPPVLSEIIVEQAAIRLSWQKPETNLDGTKPPKIAGYHIYRARLNSNNDSAETNASSSPELLNSIPVTETSYADIKFKFGINYQYFVRAVTIEENNTIIESLNSNLQSVTPRDIFAPATPQNLTIAAAPNRLSLFFAANADPDLVGYLVFRTTDEKAPLAEWRKLNTTPLTTTTFQDAAVEAGQKYYYYLQAVDNAGNLSQPSAVVSETAP